ncbi:MAG TPA: cation:proton antiporter [candidate division Zixibacteria bacterium]|nr:cation:proton antiporter [candidate division Zixibacteria bacterium]MDD4918929.1 cation:proton antiporter [candidate division Zixibacteria bacterium]MDM7972276.1 cation:proton antiporter [candidate division Zixibacteria bacterium]HPM35926.1 cation:proton antiporter [candidate division Zixibacteria bacterium]
MPEHILIGLGAIIVLGVIAQWLAWRLQLPAILLLLVFGFLAGPGTGLLRPDELFGDLLFPVVSLSVAIILFEGSLSLKFHELRDGGAVVARLTTIGIAVTWLLASTAAHVAVGLSLPIALLLGAILVVTGPTVIIPLLRQVRPVGRVGSVVKWEGIVNDPIGAILAVLVFEAVVASGAGMPSILIAGVLKALLLGSLLGLLGAALLVAILRYYAVPDSLQNSVATMLVVVVFLVSNAVQSESGLLAVTVMGIALANQRLAAIRHIYEFKENLRVILIAGLFIILAARLPVADLDLTNRREWIFVAALILVVRPAMVFASTIGSRLALAEKLFLSWMAPRGVVAAVVVSLFALRLESSGLAGGERLVPLVFKVIVATVAIYGLTVPPLARRLKVARPNPQGVLFGGAQPWIRRVAEVLKEEGFAVALIDSNAEHVARARQLGLPAFHANLLAEDIFQTLPLDDLGRFLAVTPNDDVNALAAIHFAEVFGRSGVYQLSPDDAPGARVAGGAAGRVEMPRHLQGRLLFAPHAGERHLRELLADGGAVMRTPITPEFDLKQFREIYGESAVPLFIITEDRSLKICTVQDPPAPKPGERLIALVSTGRAGGRVGDAGDVHPARL